MARARPPSLTNKALSFDDGRRARARPRQPKHYINNIVLFIVSFEKPFSTKQKLLYRIGERQSHHAGGQRRGCKEEQQTGPWWREQDPSVMVARLSTVVGVSASKVIGASRDIILSSSSRFVSISVLCCLQ